MRHAALVLVVLVALTACPGAVGVAPAPPACESADDCPEELLAGMQCGVLACGPVGAASAHCYVAPAPAGSPCTAHDDAGTVVCWGTCSTDTTCVYEVGANCGK